VERAAKAPAFGDRPSNPSGFSGKTPMILIRIEPFWIDERNHRQPDGQRDDYK
jgi:hypothetical protein